MTPWSVTITGEHWAQLSAHLFPGDDDEHGAVIRCALVPTGRGNRLLVQHVELAVDGVDFVPGDRGYRKLTASFVRENIFACAEESLVYLAVHCHGGSDHVSFSGTDMASHERGYPALLDVSGSPAVGALVFADAAIAGDIWTADGRRVPLDYLRVVDRPQINLRAVPLPRSTADPAYDRQARIFGDRGQNLLASMKIAIVGLGGAGSLVSEYLARLGVGELLLIDPDSIEETNLSRVVGSRRSDAWAWMRRPERPAWVRAVGVRLSAKKVNVAKRVARQASHTVTVDTVFGSVVDPDIADKLKDCNHIFLAADSALARRLVNGVSHQYLIPTTQIGAKVSVDRDSGAITDIFSVSRYSSPGSGCLKCNGLISAVKLQEEAASKAELARQKYVDEEEVHAPSVITLNAVAASMAVNDWLMAATGLVHHVSPDRWITYHPVEDELREFVPRKDEGCSSCGSRRLGRGDAVEMPTRVRK